MIGKGTNLSASYAGLATLASVSLMAILLVLVILIDDPVFRASRDIDSLVGEGIGFVLMTVLLFGVPVALTVGLIAKLYSVTLLRRHDLPLMILLVIASILGLLKTGIFALGVVWYFAPLGVLGGTLAAFLFHRLQAGEWM